MGTLCIYFPALGSHKCAFVLYEIVPVCTIVLKKQHHDPMYTSYTRNTVLTKSLTFLSEAFNMVNNTNFLKSNFKRYDLEYMYRCAFEFTTGLLDH